MGDWSCQVEIEIATLQFNHTVKKNVLSCYRRTKTDDRITN
jgi:hypothetical protein